LAVLLILLASTGLLSGIPRVRGQELPYGGTLRIGWVGDLEGLNPLTAFSGWYVAVFLTVYESLLWFDTDLKPTPWLARQYEASPDGLTWTFHLVNNATWHDGTPFTSADVKFTYEFLKNGNFPCAAYSCNAAMDLSSIDAPDDYTVVLHSAEPIATMTTVVATLPILPKHIWQNMTADQATKFANDNPIGTGPFKFVQWESGQFAKVVVNEHYWKTRPYIDAIVFKHYDSMDAVVLGLRSGEIDTVGISTLLPSTVRTLEQDPEIKVVISPNLRWNYIGFNQIGTGNPTLRDPRVRLALRYTVDKDTYTQLAFLGYASPGVSVIAPGMSYWYNSNLKNEYNMTKAAEILTEAGYIVRDGSGIRESPSGTKMDYKLYTYTGSEEVRIAPMWAQTLRSIGIKVTVNVVDEGTLSSIVYTDHSHDIDWWVWDLTPDPDYPLSLFNTGNPGQSENWSNSTYDQLYQQQKTATDPEVRKGIINKMQEIVFQQAPNIITSYPDLIQAHRLDTLEGYVQMVNGIAGGILNIYSYFTVHLPRQQTTSTTNTTGTSGAPTAGNEWMLVAISLIVAVAAVGYALIVRRRGSPNKPA
jgi:peptide/nickel transport system substrate-binding protein